jgi:basic amino acid/polyamine antiporter, APA family
MNLKTFTRRKSIEKIIHETKDFSDGHHSGSGMKKTLGVWDLTGFGIAAVIGAGIFSTIGNAAFNGGPGVIFLFLFTAIACGFSAFCYAEFAATLPVSGSAYTYAYASLGELLAWIIGWDLIMEYAIGNIAVAISWSDYFTSLLKGYGIHFPSFLSMDWLTAKRGYLVVDGFIQQGVALADVAAKGATSLQIEGYQAFLGAPHIFGMPVVCDLPAFVITVLVTWVVYIGIQESKRVSNVMVIVKILVLIMVVVLGAMYVQPANWNPFLPNGASGVLKGVSGVFFAYIGFDAISTTAEECKNPQRDLPRAMIFSLIICTVLYIAVALVLTGMVNYQKLAVGDPLAYVFGPEGANIGWISGVIAISAVVALFTVLLVFQLGQPRIWMAMSRDGLLPRIFGSLHPKYKTPWFSTIVTGILVGVPALFMNLTEVTDLTSIGTLCAFLLVSVGVMRLDPNRPREAGRFRIPYLSAQFIFPALSLITLVAVLKMNPGSVTQFLSTVDANDSSIQGWEVIKHKIPLATFLVGMVWLNVACLRRKLSLIPVMGVATTGYLMTELGWVNWLRFGIWLLVGLSIYLFYGIKHSKIAHEA